jgi:hypothetical protein
MSTLIPNANCWIGFSATMPVSPLLTPTAAEVSGATELTDFIININASSTGNVVPIPKLKSAFETSIPGTTTATFTAEMYRDSVIAQDTAWTMLAKGVSGVFYISRFGGTGAGKKPIATNVIEVWPVNVSSRTASALASNTAQTFTLTCSVPVVPNEAAVVS